MSSTVDWTDEESTNVQTEAYSSEPVTSTERNPATANVLLSCKIVLIAVGVLGALSNGLVLRGVWLSGRSKMTSSSVHIVNHTTLELSPFSSLSSCHPFSSPIFQQKTRRNYSQEIVVIRASSSQVYHSLDTDVDLFQIIRLGLCYLCALRLNVALPFSLPR